MRQWFSKYKGYVRYIVLHKWYVFVACCHLGIPLRGLLHDFNKLRPSQFFYYARYFFGANPKTLKGEGKNDYRFMRAWFRHQKCSDHHWQYWILPDKRMSTTFGVLRPYESEYEDILRKFDMPRNALLEMIADWYSAGMVAGKGNNISKWYRENGDDMILSPRTRQWLDEAVGDIELAQERGVPWDYFSYRWRRDSE